MNRAYRGLTALLIAMLLLLGSGVGSFACAKGLVISYPTDGVRIAHSEYEPAEEMPPEGEEPADIPVEEPVQEGAEEPMEEPAPEQPSQEPTEELPEEPEAPSADEDTAGQPAEGPEGENAQDPAGEPAEQPTDDPEAGEAPQEPLEEIVEELVEELEEETVNELIEEIEEGEIPEDFAGTVDMRVIGIENGFNLDDTIVMEAILTGFESVDYSICWECSKDDRTWTPAPGVNDDVAYSFVLTEENAGLHWRVSVTAEH